MPSAVWPVTFNPDHLYFITTRAIHGAKLFQRDVMKQILADSLNYLRQSARLKLYAFVLMPNHIHLIGQCPAKQPVMDMMRDFKKFTAKAVVAQYQNEQNETTLAFLRKAVTRPQKQQYVVWDGEYQAKDVVSPNYLVQKMNYIHNNPLQPHWALADRPENYRWSSAGFYLTGSLPVIPIDDARPLLSGMGA